MTASRRFWEPWKSRCWMFGVGCFAAVRFRLRRARDTAPCPQARPSNSTACSYFRAEPSAFLLFLFCLLSLSLVAHGTDAALAIIPDRIQLSGPLSRQRLVVEQVRDQNFVGPVTNQLRFLSNDTNVVRMEGDVALPGTNGAATITAEAGAQTTKTEVTVLGMERPVEWTFRNHVQPVLAKMEIGRASCRERV